MTAFFVACYGFLLGYSCSLYQDSIATGHLYVTVGWFCFHSNFMGRQRQVSSVEQEIKKCIIELYYELFFDVIVVIYAR